jgi:hypothetical protein
MPKISELSAAGALTGTELVPVAQDGETVKATVSTLRGPDGSFADWPDSEGALALAWTSSTNIDLFVTDDVTLSSLTFPAPGRYLLRVKAVVGTPTLTWPASAFFVANTPPTLSAPPGVDVFELIYDGSNTFVSVLGQDFRT